MLDRLFKMLLAATIAGFFTLVVINNLTDYSTNFAYVQHVLLMDTIFPDSTLHWRAITNPTIHHLFFWCIIAWEMVTAGLCWLGIVQLVGAVRSDSDQFNSAKFYVLLGLISSCLLWLLPFFCVGGEWFVMWQSPVWNGQPIAFRMFGISSLVLFFVRQPD